MKKFLWIILCHQLLYTFGQLFNQTSGHTGCEEAAAAAAAASFINLSAVMDRWSRL